MGVVAISHGTACGVEDEDEDEDEDGDLCDLVEGEDGVVGCGGSHWSTQILNNASSKIQ
jgi:hypothetical protein